MSQSYDQWLTSTVDFERFHGLDGLDEADEKLKRRKNEMFEEIIEEELKKMFDFSGDEPHIVCELICPGCGHRWTSVRPENTLPKKIKCPKCMAPNHLIETGKISTL